MEQIPQEVQLFGILGIASHPIRQNLHEERESVACCLYGRFTLNVGVLGRFRRIGGLFGAVHGCTLETVSVTISVYSHAF